jgi:hypothetical protein
MRVSSLIAAALLLAALPAAGQVPPNAAARMAAQHAAMARIAHLDGIWRGPAWSLTPAGRREVIQTERIGPLLDGNVKVIEGHGYLADGTTGFNALGIISFDPATSAYTLHSYAQGYSGDFPLRITDTGYVWEIPGGPGAIIRYTATITGNQWREIGERIAGEAPPMQIFEMNLTRVGDTSWPAGDPVPPR